MSDRDEAGRFQPGNRIWEARSSAGPKPKFDNADDLWNVCVEYFQWVEANPLMETQAFAFKGEVTTKELPKMRAMTIAGLCLFIGISQETWCTWRKSRSDLAEVITRADEVIRTQKFEGASAGLLQPMIIARDLGLSDKVEQSGPGGGPVQHEVVDASGLSTGALKELANLRRSNDGTDSNGG